MDVEKVFAELGQFGRYQKWQLMLLTIPLIASSMEEISYMFTTSNVDYRCLVPECEKPNTTEFLPSWLPNAVPFDGDPPMPAWCERYIMRDPGNSNNTCSADEFLRNEKESCDRWVFSTEERTATNEFNLLCEKNVVKRTMIGTFNNIGLISNYIIISYLSDRFGRKSMLLILSLVQGILVLAESFSPSYIVFIAFEYSFAFCSTFNTAFILALESVGGEKRVLANCLCNILYSVGEAILALIMWWVQDFRVLLRVISCIKLVNLFFIWIVSESLYWHLTKEHYEKVVKTVLNIAKINKMDISQSTQNSINVLLARGEKMKQSPESVGRTSLLKELSRNPTLFLRFFICSLTWLVDVFIFFGFSLMSVSLGGNKYLNFIMMALVEIPAYIMMWIAMDHINLGRRTTLIGSCFLAGISCFLYLFVPFEAVYVRLALSLLGKFAITISYTVIYEVGAEVFPTELRQSMVGLCCAVACLGGLFAPQIPLLALYVNPMLVFFLMSVSAGSLCFLLPETKGLSLPDTIAQAAKIA